MSSRAPASALERAEARPRRGSPLTVVLFRNFGILVGLAVLAVLAVGLWTATRNTMDLLQDKADLTIRQLEFQVRDNLGPGSGVVEAVARAVERGAIEHDRPADFQHFLEGALSGVPQIGAILYVRNDLRGYGATREDGKLVTRVLDLRKDADVRAALRTLGTTRRTSWVGPVWRQEIKSTLLVARRGVFRDGKRVGAVLAMVRIRELSSYLRDSTRGTNINAFILLDRWRVLAHPELVTGSRGRAWRPTPALSELHDPVMRNLWNPAASDEPMLRPRPPLENRIVTADGVTYVVFYKNIAGYGSGQWTIGAYARAESFGQQIERLLTSLVVGLVALLVAVLLAILIGRRLARPVRGLSDAARRVAAFDLDGIRDLPSSNVRELDEQSRAFNSMLGAMRWFQAYVPKTLARRLVQTGSLSGIVSDNRNLTVMFTDVAGFSALAEGAGAAQVADFLNDHFDLVTRCIDEQGGTVDKFIGDSVMAFWGAPEKQKNRAERAARAALAIRDAISADNARRVGRGLPRVRIRIGIHSGRATVGNIGPADRVNYTAIGDMVNVAQRLEQLGKQVDDGSREAVILVSGKTREDLGEGFVIRSIGDRQLRGRDGEVEVFELVDGPTDVFDGEAGVSDRISRE